ncbi:MAG: fructosamine kinase family protein [Gammaproteobacteria bacterium]
MPDTDHSLAALSQRLSSTLGGIFEPHPSVRVHGGCINDSFRWQSSNGPLFVKIANRYQLSMLEAEARGLRELDAANAVRVPVVLDVGEVGNGSFLALEWIELSCATGEEQARLGTQLARQHRVLATRFGWDSNNTIGSTAQLNTWSDDWLSFFRERRLRCQLELARRNGHGGRLQDSGNLLLERMDQLLGEHRPAPSLLHGDLWDGNIGADPSGAPVIFDPAVYFGDREADLAMTRLFGGFSREFYAAYEKAWPLPASAAGRVDLYNLYHVLNHLNLFGTGYLAQAQSLIDRLLARA